MTTAQNEGAVEIVKELCKGCNFCVVTCPEEVLAFSERINSRGYRFAYYLGAGCNGCGICFYNCPEPGAITVYKKGAIRTDRGGMRVG